MARLPTPDRGQPIDVPYIYTMATAINNLSDQIDQSTEKYATIYTRELADPQNLKISDTKIFATYYDLQPQIEVTTRGQTQSFGVNISGFKYPPIVTATPVNTGGDSGNDITVSINSITASRIDGVVIFNSIGTVSAAINIIAVGIPS